MRLSQGFLVFASAGLLGCSFAGKPTREVHLHLRHEGKPIHGAHIRAVAVDASAVPLPVSADSLEQSSYAVGDTAATDAEGLASLRLYTKTPHLIEVAPPPFGPLAGTGPWIWRLDAEAATLSEQTDNDALRRPSLRLQSH